MISDEFKYAITEGAKPAATCSFCKTVYVARKITEQQAKQLEPFMKGNKCIRIAGNVVAYGRIGGVLAVCECNCEALEAFETWMLENRDMIHKYFNRIREREALLGQKQLTPAQALLKTHEEKGKEEKGDHQNTEG